MVVALSLGCNNPHSEATEFYIEGVDLYYMGKYEGAIQAYDKAIEINPEYAQAWSGKGDALCLIGRSEEAIQAYDKAIEIDPEYTRCLE